MFYDRLTAFTQSVRLTAFTQSVVKNSILEKFDPERKALQSNERTQNTIYVPNISISKIVLEKELNHRIWPTNHIKRKSKQTKTESARAKQNNGLPLTMN